MPGFDSEAQQVLKETENVQQQTKDALYRIQRQTAQTEELGTGTLVAMREQRYQMEKIQIYGDELNANIEKSKRLQDRFDRWAFNWIGRDKRRAQKEAKQHIQAMERDRRIKNIGNEDGNTASETTKKIKKGKKKGKVSNINITRPPPRTDLVTIDRNDPKFQQLDHTTQASLERVEYNDQEIDKMLDATAASLDHLLLLSQQIKQETKLQGEKIDNIDKTLEKGTVKQLFVTARAKHFVKA